MINAKMANSIANSGETQKKIEELTNNVINAILEHADTSVRSAAQEGKFEARINLYGLEDLSIKHPGAAKNAIRSLKTILDHKGFVVGPFDERSQYVTVYWDQPSVT